MSVVTDMMELAVHSTSYSHRDAGGGPKPKYHHTYIGHYADYREFFLFLFLFFDFLIFWQCKRYMKELL